MTDQGHLLSKSDRWFTPVAIVAAVRATLGGIDLDPASEPLANARVGAAMFFDEADNGLTRKWSGRVFLNPPGGVYPKGHPLSSKSRTLLFWDKLMEEVDGGRLAGAIFMAFSVNFLASSQGRSRRSGVDFVHCVPRDRIRFDLPDGLPGPQPTHANAVIYVPGTEDRTDQFVAAFEHLGGVMRPFRVRP